ncbi:Zn-dependent exopeptidase [Linnemannia elongata AG-77]|uniref:Peptide hydrolase n=1 Tax=Linnemannia elongata AG-77 TaxID=1314771 RepID=A0A197JQ63_9FUNG|nr:Zn-dependent exopeptidase [Linnemannia elongata AG-77]
MADPAGENQPLLPSSNGGPRQQAPSRNRRYVIYGAIGLVFIGLSTALMIRLVKPHDEPPKSPLSDKLTTPAVFSHLEELYAIALKHNNSRSVTNGYMASADYVQTQLQKKAHKYCDISTQEFKVPVWSELEAPELTSSGIGSIDSHVLYQNKVDFQNFRYGGPSAKLKKQSIQGVDNNGCSAKDHKKVSGKIAVIQEGGPCELWEAAYNAENAGATGVLFYNNPKRKALLFSRIRITAWKEGDPLISIPVLSITNSLGSTLLQNQDKVVLNLKTVNRMTVEPTINVLCTTRGGDDDDTIVLGAHLDSVPEGPGMVDNGSGSSSLLEIALVMAKNNYRLKNKIVFGWWGAEEIGLLGSRHYVRELVKDQEAKDKIAMNMNFDMLASPNYVPYVHDGKTAPEALVGPSSKIDHLLIEYFDSKSEGYEYTDMTGGSDFLPFLLEGIPSGGLLTGAGERKTMEQRTLFGGFANAPLDPCYHQSCDTLENVSKRALGLMAQAALYAITKLGKAENLREWLANTEAALL